MSGFVSCERCKYATEGLNGKHCGCCKHNESQRCIENFTHITNADRIRAMSDEELAEDRIYDGGFGFHDAWFGDFGHISGTKADAMKLEIEWLQSEAESEEV